MNRQFQDLGIQPVLAYLFLFVGFVAVSTYLFYKTELAQYIYLLSAVSLISGLSETRRNDFLKLCFGDGKLKRLRLAENFIVAFPFLLVLLLKVQLLSALTLTVIAALFAVVNFRTSINLVIPTPFYRKPFEFTTGFRNTFYLIFIAYALTIIAVAVGNFNLGMFALLLVFAVTLTYYTQPEHQYYVWMHNLSPKMFLFRKIKTAVLHSAYLVLPIAITLGIYSPESIDVLLLFLLMGWAFLVCRVIIKYAAYPDTLTIPQGILLALCFGFPPLLLAVIPYLFSKSENRLSNLLK